MKLKEGFIVKNIAGSIVVVPVGEEAVKLKGLIHLNATSAFLWNKLESDISFESLVEAFALEYAIDLETARTDVTDFLNVLKQRAFLTNNE